MNRDNFETTLVLSTAHMPKPAPDFGGLRTAVHEFGWIVWPGDGAPDWICPTLEYAKIQSCSMVLYDRDATTIDHLQVWDW